MKRRLILLLALLLVTGCTGAKSTQNAPSPTPGPITPATQSDPAKSQAAQTPEEPTLTAGPLHLLAIPPGPLWAGPVTVVVENSPQSRPQTGLDRADMIIEALAESEITRFLAFYWSTPAERIGPVRSARTGFVSVAEAYHAPFAHSGANADALSILALEWGARDLDEIYNAGAYFVRSNDRVPPHNLYTSTQLLDQAVTGRKLAMKAVPATLRQSSPPTPGQAATKVEIDWHRLHKLSWELKEGRYRRFEDGQAHKLDSGDQIQATNLVFLHVKGANNGPDLGWALDFQPGGKATVLSAGHTWEGTWSLQSGGFVLKPSAGKVPLLAPGATWVHLITHESSFRFTGSNP